MLIIDNALVSKLLTMEDCIRVQEEAFAKLPNGAAMHRPRVDMYVPCEREDGYFRWGSMEGANDGYFAIRMKSDIITWPRNANGSWTEDKYCRAPGTYCGIVFIISTRNAEPLAFINDGVLQHMRVGGGAGMGAKYLARTDSHVVGLLGSGGMARTFLEAFTCVRDIRLCKVYSPTPANREAFAQDMSRRLNIEVRAVDSPREAVRGADILSSCTNSMQPVYEADWIEKGMHVTNLGRREMPDAAMARFDVVVRQGTAGLQMKESERFQAERGLSPGAFIGHHRRNEATSGKKSGAWVWRRYHRTQGPRQRRRPAGFRRSHFRHMQGPRQPRPGHVLSQCRQSRAAVLRGRRLGLCPGSQERPRP
jgi:alanine dehydrogenase